MRVLLVDDSATVRVGVSAALRAGGWEVRTAGGVSEGHATAVSWEPDAVVVDVMMVRAGGGNAGGGLQLLRWLRRDLPGTPVVMLTSDGSETGRNAAFGLEAAGYVIKGKTLAETAQALRAAVEEGVRSIGHRRRGR